jgi:hypothetical protein
LQRIAFSKVLWLKILSRQLSDAESPPTVKVGLGFSYISRILRLLNLAPDLQEAIINGEEPDGLSLGKLRGNLPESLQEQREMLKV